MNGTTQAWLQHVCWARSHYALPPRADTQAHGIVDGTLALLFPHLALERRCEPDYVLNEIEALRWRLHAFLRDKGRDETDAYEMSAHFVDRLPVLHEALLLDAQATCDADPAATSIDEVILAYPGIYALACHRLAHDLLQMGVLLLPRLITELAHKATGIDIHPAARLGHSIAIDHGTGIVIGETTSIGEPGAHLPGRDARRAQRQEGPRQHEAPPDDRRRRGDLRERHDPGWRHGRGPRRASSAGTSGSRTAYRHDRWSRTPPRSRRCPSRRRTRWIPPVIPRAAGRVSPRPLTTTSRPAGGHRRGGPPLAGLPQR